MTHMNVAFSLCCSPGLASASQAAGFVPGSRAGVCQQAQTLGDLEDTHTHRSWGTTAWHMEDWLEEGGMTAWLLSGMAQQHCLNWSITRGYSAAKPPEKGV